MAFNLDPFIDPVHCFWRDYSSYALLFFIEGRDENSLLILLSLLPRDRFATSEPVSGSLALLSW